MVQFIITKLPGKNSLYLVPLCSPMFPIFHDLVASKHVLGNRKLSRGNLTCLARDWAWIFVLSNVTGENRKSPKILET